MLLLEFLCDSEEIIRPNSLLYIKTTGVHNSSRIFYVYSRVGLHMPSEFFGTSFEAIFSFHVNNHGNHLRPLFFVRLLLLGSQGDASSSEASPDSIDSWNRYMKLGPFFPASSFDHNFQPNNNQTFIVYVKSTLILYRKGLCGFFAVPKFP